MGCPAFRREEDTVQDLRKLGVPMREIRSWVRLEARAACTVGNPRGGRIGRPPSIE